MFYHFFMVIISWKYLFWEITTYREFKNLILNVSVLLCTNMFIISTLFFNLPILKEHLFHLPIPCHLKEKVLTVSSQKHFLNLPTLPYFYWFFQYKLNILWPRLLLEFLNLFLYNTHSSYGIHNGFFW